MGECCWIVGGVEFCVLGVGLCCEVVDFDEVVGEDVVFGLDLGFFGVVDVGVVLIVVLFEGVDVVFVVGVLFDCLLE